MNDAEKIIAFISDMAEVPEDIQLSTDTSLFNNKLLDSMYLVAMIAFLEETFKIQVKPMDIVYENFDTINNILAYIKRQQMGTAVPGLT